MSLEFPDRFQSYLTCFLKPKKSETDKGPPISYSLKAKEREEVSSGGAPLSNCFLSVWPGSGNPNSW